MNRKNMPSPDTNASGQTSLLLGRSSIYKISVLVISTVASFITLPVVLNMLGTHWYGIWVIVGTFMGYFGLLDFGLSSATSRFLAYNWEKKVHDKIGSIVSTSLSCFFGLSFIALLLCLAIIFFTPHLVNNPSDTHDIQLILIIMAFDMATAFPVAVFNSVLVVKLRHDIISSIEIAKIVIRTSLIIWVAANNGTIIDLALIVLGVNLLGRVIQIVVSLKMLPNGVFKFEYISVGEVKNLFGFGKFSFLGEIGDILRSRIDVMVIGAILTSTSVAYYSIALQLTAIIVSLVGAMVMPIAPVFTKYYAENRLDQMREKLLLMTRISLTFSVMACTSAMIIAEPFIKIWVGEEMLSAVIPFYILAILVPLGIGQNPLVQVLYATARHHYYAYLNLVEAGANVILSIILVQYYGIIGIAIGTAVPFVISKVFLLPPISCRCIDMPVSIYRKNAFNSCCIILALELPLIIFTYFYGAFNIWQIMTIVTLWQGIIGFGMIRFIISAGDYSYLIGSLPVLHKIINRPHKIENHQQ